MAQKTNPPNKYFQPPRQPTETPPHNSIEKQSENFGLAQKTNPPNKYFQPPRQPTETPPHNSIEKQSENFGLAQKHSGEDRIRTCGPA